MLYTGAYYFIQDRADDTVSNLQLSYLHVQYRTPYQTEDTVDIHSHTLIPLSPWKNILNLFCIQDAACMWKNRARSTSNCKHRITEDSVNLSTRSHILCLMENSKAQN